VASRLLNGSFLPQSCLDVVCAAFRDYRIDVPTLCIPQGWKDHGHVDATDDERRLAWLRRCVAPCVERLTDHYGLEIVLDSLGMDAVIETLEGQRIALNSLSAEFERQTGLLADVPQIGVETLH
jgi:hypothetical protein